MRRMAVPPAKGRPDGRASSLPEADPVSRFAGETQLLPVTLIGKAPGSSPEQDLRLIGGCRFARLLLPACRDFLACSSGGWTASRDGEAVNRARAGRRTRPRRSG